MSVENILPLIHFVFHISHVYRIRSSHQTEDYKEPSVIETFIDHESNKYMVKSIKSALNKQIYISVNCLSIFVLNNSFMNLFSLWFNRQPSITLAKQPGYQNHMQQMIKIEKLNIKRKSRKQGVKLKQHEWQEWVLCDVTKHGSHILFTV